MGANNDFEITIDCGRRLAQAPNERRAIRLGIAVTAAFKQTVSLR